MRLQRDVFGPGPRAVDRVLQPARALKARARWAAAKRERAE